MLASFSRYILPQNNVRVGSYIVLETLYYTRFTATLVRSVLINILEKYLKLLEHLIVNNS